MDITIKNYKSCRGNESDAFSCTLYLDGKRAATVQYDGWGGPFMIDFTISDGRSFGGPMSTAFQAHVASLPEKPGIAGTTYKPDGDAVIGAVIDKMKVEKLCKGRVCFRLEGDSKGTFRSYKGTWSPAEKAALVKEYGDKLIECVNERFAGA